MLCNLADYLIQLTALKQKISSEIESVSMDADVTLMTKYCGLKTATITFKGDNNYVKSTASAKVVVNKASPNGC